MEGQLEVIGRVRDSVMCRVRDLFVCRVRDSFVRRVCDSFVRFLSNESFETRGGDPVAGSLRRDPGPRFLNTNVRDSFVRDSFLHRVRDKGRRCNDRHFEVCRVRDSFVSRVRDSFLCRVRDGSSGRQFEVGSRAEIPEYWVFCSSAVRRT